jgi:hypothetical protein
MSYSPHSLLVKEAIAVVIAVAMEAIVVSEGATEAIAVSVRKETDRVGIGVHAHRAIGHRAHRGTVRRVRKESAVSVGRVHKETAHRETVRHVHHVRKVRTGHRVRKETVVHVLKRLQQRL